MGIGLVSYSFYLWHQPLLAFGKIYFGELSFNFKILLISISFILSFISYFYVEKLFRNKKKIKTSFLNKLVFGFILFFLLVSITVINTYNSRSIYSTEYHLAKTVSESNVVKIPDLDKRNFTKFKILFSKKDLDNLIIGSSRISFIGNKMLNSRSLNLSVGTATIEDHVALTLMSLERLNFDKIFLAVDPWLFNATDFKPYSDRWKSLSKEYNKSIEKIANKNIATSIFDEKELNNQIGFGGELTERIYKQFNLRQKKLVLDPNKENKQAYLTYADGTEKFKAKSMELQGKPITHFMSPYLHSKQKEKLFKQLINHIIDNNKQVVLVLIPFYEKSYDLTVKKNNLMLERENFFIDLAKNKNNIQVIGSYNPRKVGCNEKEFYDDIHPKESCHLKIIKQKNFKDENQSN